MGPIDASQLSRWFTAYGPALVLYARQWLDAARAEDAVQDVFVRLMSQGSSPARVKAWLFRSVRNAAISQLRSQARRRKRERRVAADRPEWFEGGGDDLIDAGAVQAALAGLPEQQREAIVLRIWAGMTLNEIADVVGQPISTMFSRYRAGLAGIRRRMEMSCKIRND